MKPIPSDFAEHGRERTADLTKRYGVCKDTIAKWRRQANIVMTTGRPSGREKLHDPTITTCLSCKRPRCNGFCPDVGRG